MDREKFRLIEHGDDQIAAALENFSAGRYEVLRPVQRLHRRPLGDGAGARGLLTLNDVHRANKLFRSRGIADAPTRHGIGFGHPVHRQGAVVKRWFDLRRRFVDEVAVDEVFIHVVGQDPHLRMAQQDLCQGFEFSLVIGEPEDLTAN